LPPSEGCGRFPVIVTLRTPRRRPDLQTGSRSCREADTGHVYATAVLVISAAVLTARDI
jgi:hypothetical protein